MRYRIGLALIILFRFSQIAPAQATPDSTATGIGLDFLVGRIGNGLALSNFHSARNSKSTYYIGGEYETESTNRYEDYRPHVGWAKDNFFSVALHSYSNRNIAPAEDQTWRHQATLKIIYRPLNSIQFYFDNTYWLDKDIIDPDIHRSDLKQVTDSDPLRTFSYGCYYLSQGGKIRVQKNLSKWMYHFMPGLNSTQFYLNEHTIFVNPNQLLVIANGLNSSEKLHDSVTNLLDENNPPLVLEKNSYYRSQQSQEYNLMAYYNFKNLLLLRSMIIYDDDSDSHDSQYDLTSSESNEYTLIRDDFSHSNQGTNNYHLSLHSVPDGNIWQQVVYNYQCDEKNYTAKNWQSRYGLYSHDSYNRRNILHNIGYVFNFLNLNQAVPELKILSDYDDYYGHLLPKSRVKWTSAINLTYYKDKDVSWLEDYALPGEAPKSRLHESEIRRNEFSWEQRFAYGLTNSVNMFVETRLHRMMVDHAPHYRYNAGLRSRLGIIYVNRQYHASIMNWADLTEFDHWVGPLLAPGMFKISTSVSPFTYARAWTAASRNWFELQLDRLRAIGSSSVNIDASIGLPWGIESSFQGNVVLLPEYKKEYSYYLHPQLRWRLFKNMLFRIQYQYNYHKHLTSKYRTHNLSIYCAVLL